MVSKKCCKRLNKPIVYCDDSSQDDYLNNLKRV